MIIGLITDFGSKGLHYVAEMKGIGLKINSDLHFMDISHEITPFQIVEANYVLQTVYHTLPKKTIFVCVVDPGVGTSRDILAFHTKDDYFFVGPDNGMFSYFIQHQLINQIVRISNSQYYNPIYQEGMKSGNKFTITFHGRDIMMPVAAFMALGTPLEKFGPKITDISQLKNLSLNLEIKEYENPEISVIIQYIDAFGNLITNLDISTFLKIINQHHYRLNLICRSKRIPLEFQKTFANNPSEKVLFIPGSSGFMEICQNQQNAAHNLQLSVSNSCIVQFIRRDS